jgi:HK97 family phage prohead protease
MKKRRTPSGVQHRFADIAAPSSYDEATRSVEAILSTGASVRRGSFIERLEISKKSVDLSRFAVAGSLPLLDSHSNGSISSVLGKVVDIRIVGSELRGRLAFADTKDGRRAEELVKQRIITSVSIGYLILSYRLEESIDDYEDLPTYVVERFQVAEVSLVGVPADASATIRSLGSTASKPVRDALARMQIRQRMYARMRSR